MPQEPAAFTSAPAERESPLAGLTFRLDDVLFACEGDVSTLDLSELAGLAAAGDAGNHAQAMATLAAFLQIALGAQYMRFKVHCREHRTDDDTLIAIMQLINEHIGMIVEVQTARPTARQSPSSDGPAGKDERISRVISLGRGDVTLVPSDQTYTPGLGLAGKKDAQVKPVKGSAATRRNRSAS